MWRVRLSRWMAWHLLGRREMLCAWSDWNRWPLRHLLNALFFWERDHCAKSADWEAWQAREADFIERARREGWL